MILTLQRERSDSRCTFGKLSVDGVYQCETLEDVMRPAGVKVHGQTAIPPGTYLVVENWSDRFQRMLPLVVGVPGFEGIRIHPGNTDKDTEGCILVGTSRAQDTILHSRDAFNALYAKLHAAWQKEKVYLEIKNPA